MVINTANANGSNPQEFFVGCALRVPLGCSGASHPAWSPDGGTIAFTNWGTESGREIYVKDIGKDVVTRLTAGPADNHHAM